LIETPRLILRRWREADTEPYVSMMADPRVGYWLGGPFGREESLERIAKNEATLERHGWGRMAIERKSDGAFLGYCGLAPIREDLPVDGYEVGWSLVPDAWGAGYATEAATAVFADGFARMDLPEIIAFTAETNRASQAVAARLGMARAPALDYDHPDLAEGSPIRRHLVFVSTRP
jgi:RimJ/RimL family protein N-acetyltransferase